VFTVRLETADRPALRAHLLELGAEDRYLRFGHSVTDIRIEQYVDHIDFAHDAVFGVNTETRHFDGIVHLALDGMHAELGVSVLPPYRGRGIGTALVSRAAIHARNRGIELLFMQCLSHNCAIMRIAANLGMQVVTAGPESEGSMQLPSASPLSILRELVTDRMALCDAALRERLFSRTAAVHTAQESSASPQPRIRA